MLGQTIKIVAQKPEIETPLGIKYFFVDDHILITGIKEESIFTDSELRVGHFVIEVNGSPVAGKSIEEIRTLLSSLGEHVVFLVEKTWSATFQLHVTSKSTTEKNSGARRTYDSIVVRVNKKARYILNNNRKNVPLFLEGREVPLSTWHQIYDMLDKHLLPAVASSLKVAEILKQEIASYKNGMMTGGTGPIQRKIFQITQNAHMLENSATLVGTKVASTVDSMVRPYGLTCQLDLEKCELPKWGDDFMASGVYHGFKIQGLEFIPLETLQQDYSIALMSSDNISVISGFDLDGADMEIDARWC